MWKYRGNETEGGVQRIGDWRLAGVTYIGRGNLPTVSMRYKHLKQKDDCGAVPLGE